MSRKWIDRVISGAIGAVLVLISTMITMSMAWNYDEEMSMKEKVTQLDLKKADRATTVRKEVYDAHINNENERFELLLEEIRENRKYIRDLK